MIVKCQHFRSHIYLVLCSFLFFTGCTKSENQGVTQSPTTTAAPTPANEVLQPKSLPVLGDSETQAKFKLADLNAIIESKPRPTEPQTLAVLAGNPPAGTDVCNLAYSALIQAMYQKCFLEGISQIKMSNIIGWAGEEISRSGDTVIYKWGNGDKGSLTATFVKGGLTSKSQNGLK
jgi:hypothetical protein